MIHDNTEKLEGTPLFMVQQMDVRGTVECNLYPVRAEYADAIKQCFAEDDFFCSFTVETVAYYGKISSIRLHFSLMPGEASELFAELEDRANAVLDRFIDSMRGYHIVQA
jgi:hypothetical protein